MCRGVRTQLHVGRGGHKRAYFARGASQHRRRARRRARTEHPGVEVVLVLDKADDAADNEHDHEDTREREPHAELRDVVAHDRDGAQLAPEREQHVRAHEVRGVQELQREDGLH